MGFILIPCGEQKGRFLGALSTSVAADAIINSGPREADANPIQISDNDGRTPLAAGSEKGPCGSGVSQGEKKKGDLEPGEGRQ